eukprot:1013473-Lingulodinium_polyedra.AAC.1
MGATCICNGITDPVYIATNANCSAPTSGSKDRDPDSGSAKHIDDTCRLQDANGSYPRTWT